MRTLGDDLTRESVPSPLQALEIALELMGRTIDRVGPDQWASPTPCPEWNVSELVNYNIRNVRFATGLFDGSDGPNPMNVASPLAPDGSDGKDAAKLFFEASTGLIAAVKNLGPERQVDTPFGRMRGEGFLPYPSTDLVIHAWDLAQATGNVWEIDEGLADICYRTRLRLVEMAQKHPLLQRDFAPPLELPPDASIQEKLLALSGRQP